MIQGILCFFRKRTGWKGIRSGSGVTEGWIPAPRLAFNHGSEDYVAVGSGMPDADATHGRVKLVWVPRYVGIRGDEVADELARKIAERTPASPEPIIRVTFMAWMSECFPGAFTKMERAGRGIPAVTGPHSEPRSRTHQAVTRSGEERGEVVGWPADWAQHPEEASLRWGGRC